MVKQFTVNEYLWVRSPLKADSTLFSLYLKCFLCTSSSVVERRPSKSDVEGSSPF